jgi:hypothetical protein
MGKRRLQVQLVVLHTVIAVADSLVVVAAGVKAEGVVLFPDCGDVLVLVLTLWQVVDGAGEAVPDGTTGRSMGQLERVVRLSSGGWYRWRGGLHYTPLPKRC